MDKFTDMSIRMVSNSFENSIIRYYDTWHMG